MCMPWSGKKEFYDDVYLHSRKKSQDYNRGVSESLETVLTDREYNSIWRGFCTS